MNRTYLHCFIKLFQSLISLTSTNVPNNSNTSKNNKKKHLLMNNSVAERDVTITGRLSSRFSVDKGLLFPLHTYIVVQQYFHEPSWKRERERRPTLIQHSLHPLVYWNCRQLAVLYQPPSLHWCMAWHT